MDWIYISPHLDDVVLSLGGLIWEQSQDGLEVCIWTVCAGDPPPGQLSSFAQSLHERWGADFYAMEERRKEDILSSKLIGAKHFHMDIPDCIYRRSRITNEFLYDSEESLWGSVRSDERYLIHEISYEINNRLSTRSKVVCPLALGNHVDHHLTRTAVEEAFHSSSMGGTPQIYYYAEYPYVLECNLPLQCTEKSSLHLISQNGIRAWQDGIAAHNSQISTFWKNLDEMRNAIESYYDVMGGIWLGE